MQLTRSITAALTLLTAVVSAAPAAQSLNPDFLSRRAASKLNQYSNLDCKDNSGGNAPTFHASPPARKCYEIDSSTKSFYFGLGPLHQTWVYSNAGCNGLSVNLGGAGGCQKVDANFSDAFKSIRSIMMD